MNGQTKSSFLMGQEVCFFFLLKQLFFASLPTVLWTCRRMKRAIRLSVLRVATQVVGARKMVCVKIGFFVWFYFWAVLVWIETG